MFSSVIRVSKDVNSFIVETSVFAVENTEEAHVGETYESMCGTEQCCLETRK